MSKGVVLSVSASVLFAVMYYFTSLLTPLSGLEIFGWRMLLTVPCMTVFMIVSGEWRRVRDLLRVLAAKPRWIAGVMLYCSGRSPACSTARTSATNCAVPAAMRRCIKLSWMNKTGTNHAFDRRQRPLRLG